MAAQLYTPIAKQQFLAAIKQQGGALIDGYLGSHIPVSCLCGKGHSHFVFPYRIMEGEPICNGFQLPATLKFLIKALDLLRVPYQLAAPYPSMKTLYCHIMVVYKNANFYLEITTPQHHEWRQELIKQHVITSTSNCFLAELDSEWIQYLYVNGQLAKFLQLVFEHGVSMITKTNADSHQSKESADKMQM